MVKSPRASSAHPANMFDLKDRIAFVTGGSRGIGRGICLALASRGATVVIGYRSGEDEARQTAEDAAARGGRAEIVQIDVAEHDAAEKVIADAAKRHGGLDVMVANAGISLDGLLLRLKTADLEKTLSVNLTGAISCARAAIKPMMRRKRGRIIFVSSVVGEMGNAGQTAYAASKAALFGVTKSLAREYASRAITVNAVAPGYIKTDMTSGLTDEQTTAMLGAVPLARAGHVEEVAASVVYLASDEAAYVTGHTLRVNGGMYM